MKKTFEITTSTDVDLSQDDLHEILVSNDTRIDDGAGIISVKEIPNTELPDQTQEVAFNLPVSLAREAYIAMCDAHHRLEKGNMALEESIKQFSTNSTFYSQNG